MSHPSQWKETLTFSSDDLQSLEVFIHEPDTRRSDIFREGTLAEHDGVRIDWVIKHDLFEGVVVHFSALNADGTIFYGGDQATLRDARDLIGTYHIRHGESTYDITVTSA
ncbi:MAG: hypothetical protein OWU33_11960 [Firmicutes bacterium]|nr:hypothetical protein [Bacillota bacterium]